MTYEEKRDRVYDIWVKCMKPGTEGTLYRAMKRLDERELDNMLEGCIIDNLYALNQNAMGWTFLFCLLRGQMTPPQPQGILNKC